MKRDLLCITEIIRKLEKSKFTKDEIPIEIKVKGYSKAIIDYHILLLKDADFIKTSINDQNRELPTRLTWKGYEYIDESLNSAIKIIDEGIDTIDELS